MFDDEAPLSTGDTAVDELLGGGLRSGIYQLVGLPGVGKSAFLRVMTELHRDNDKNVVFIDADGGALVPNKHRINDLPQLLAVLQYYEQLQKQQECGRDWPLMSANGPKKSHEYSTMIPLLIIDSLATLLRVPGCNTVANTWRISTLLRRIAKITILVNHLTFAEPVDYLASSGSKDAITDKESLAAIANAEANLKKHDLNSRMSMMTKNDNDKRSIKKSMKTENFVDHHGAFSQALCVHPVDLSTDGLNNDVDEDIQDGDMNNSQEITPLNNVLLDTDGFGFDHKKVNQNGSDKDKNGNYRLKPALGEFFSHLVDHTLVLTPTELSVLNSICIA